MGLFDRISAPDGMLELARFLEELNARVERLERSAADAVALYDLEHERQARWWSTYHAALTGLLSGAEVGSENERAAHKRACAYANKNHGPLTPKE